MRKGIKAFKIIDKDINININIKGTLEDPLFQANQIGKILEIKNVVDNLRDFNEDEKVLFLTYTQGGPQKTLFLTEVGLYRLLGRSRKPIYYIL
jgi:prophage antirepressor-like protein